MSKKRTSPTVAAKAAKALTSPTTSADEKSIAASALAQAEPAEALAAVTAAAVAAVVTEELVRAAHEPLQPPSEDPAENVTLTRAEYNFLFAENDRMAREVARLTDELEKQQAWRASSRRG